MGIVRLGIRVENIDGLDAQFMEVMEAIDANLEETASYIEAEAQHTAAFIDKTGNLRKSIKKRKSRYKDGGYIVRAAGKGKDKGYHAHLVEFGHVKILWGKPTGERVAAHPFMRPAAEKGITKAVELFRVTKK